TMRLKRRKRLEPWGCARLILVRSILHRLRWWSSACPGLWLRCVLELGSRGAASLQLCCGLPRAGRVQPRPAERMLHGKVMGDLCLGAFRVATERSLDGSNAVDQIRTPRLKPRPELIQDLVQRRIRHATECFT